MAIKQKANYTDEFKSQAVRLALELGPGRAAKQLGVSGAALQYWKKKHTVEKKLSVKEQASADREELQRLRKEVEELKKVNYILKRAAAFFSQDQLK
jgi:transposase